MLRPVLMTESLSALLLLLLHQQSLRTCILAAFDHVNKVLLLCCPQ